MADGATGRECRPGVGKEVGTRTGGDAKVPHFVRAKAEASVEGWMGKSNLSDAPRLWPRGEGRVLHFGGVVKSAEGAGDGD